MRDVRNSVPVGGDGGEAVEEDDNAKQGDRQEPGGVESDPGEIDANFLSEVPPGETKHMYRYIHVTIHVLPWVCCVILPCLFVFLDLACFFSAVKHNRKYPQLPFSDFHKQIERS